MGRRKNIIIIPVGLPADWPCDFEFQAARALSDRNTIVLAPLNQSRHVIRLLMGMEAPLRKSFANTYTIHPFHFLPMDRFPVIHTINTAIFQAFLMVVTTIVSFLRGSSRILWMVSSQLDTKPWIFAGFYKVYDCVDYISSTRVERDHVLKRKEAGIMRQADIVCTNSTTLYRMKKQHHRNVHLVPAGFTEPRLGDSDSDVPDNLNGIPRPIVGYIGALNMRLDFDFISSVADQLPQVSFVFIGPVDGQYDGFHQEGLISALDSLRKRKNIHILPQIPKHLIGEYLSRFSVGYIPYDIRQEYVRNAFPMKTLEYLYAGVPVIATGITELKNFYPYVLTVPHATGAITAIRKIIGTPVTDQYKKKARRLAQHHTWSGKFDSIRSAILLTSGRRV